MTACLADGVFEDGSAEAEVWADHDADVVVGGDGGEFFNVLGGEAACAGDNVGVVLSCRSCDGQYGVTGGEVDDDIRAGFTEEGVHIGVVDWVTVGCVGAEFSAGHRRDKGCIVGAVDCLNENTPHAARCAMDGRLE